MVFFNRSIDHLGHGLRARDGFVESERQSQSYRREETKDRFRRLGHATVRFDELNRAGAAVARNLWKPLRDVSALVRCVLDEAA